VIEVFRIGQNMRLPYYPIQVRDKDGVVDLSVVGVTAVYFCMATLLSGAYGSVIVGSTVTSTLANMTDLSNGSVEYRWAAVDTATVGEYSAAFLFVTANGNFALPRNEVAKVIVEDIYNTIPAE